MDYQTAHRLLVSQGMATAENPDALLIRLQQGSPPVPGQITSILLALKVVFEALKDAAVIDRELACSLHLLSNESRYYFDRGHRTGITWPPLLDEDLTRIATTVKSIFMGSWQGN